MLTVQTNWLPEPDHGALYELIGPGGRYSQYSYEGPLGSTGVRLDILSGGPGDSYLPTAATLYAGNPVKRVTPQLTMGSSESTIEYSKKFPTVGVVSLQEHDPLVLIYDPAKWHELDTISALAAAAHKGAKFYVSSLSDSYVQFLVERGVPESSFIGGYSGDLDKFATGAGMIIQQGYVDSEVYMLEHQTRAWDKPVKYVFFYKLGLNDYDEIIQVKKSSLAPMTPCLRKLVPMIQQAEVDYFEHPAGVDSVLEKFNPRYGAAYWVTDAAYNKYSVSVQRSQDIVGNTDGGKGPVGAFNLVRMEGVVHILVPIYKKQKDTTYYPGVSASQILTNEFIDPHIKFPT